MAPARKSKRAQTSSAPKPCSEVPPVEDSPHEAFPMGSPAPQIEPSGGASPHGVYFTPPPPPTAPVGVSSGVQPWEAMTGAFDCLAGILHQQQAQQALLERLVTLVMPGQPSAQIPPLQQSQLDVQVSPATPSQVPLPMQPRFALPEETILIEKFLKLRPESFLGNPDPTQAEYWIKQMVKKLDSMVCPMRYRVTLAAYMLEGAAGVWWEATKRIVPVDYQWTWETFCTKFYDKYFPQAYRKEKMTEFLELKQGNMSVAQYEDKFAELASYVPRAIEDLEYKAHKFQEGLRSSIKSKICVLKLQTYEEIVDHAMIAEKDTECYPQKHTQNKQAGQKFRAAPSVPATPEKRLKVAPSQSTVPEQRRSKEKRECHYCGKVGHIVRKCLKKKVDEGKEVLQKNSPTLQSQQVAKSTQAACLQAHKKESAATNHKSEGGLFAMALPEDVEEDHRAVEVAGHTLVIDMGSKGRMPPPHLRRPLPGPGMMHPDPYGPGMHPPPGAYPPFDMLPPPELMEQKLAAQHVEMQRLATENQRLAATHSALRQELAAAQQELQRLQGHIGAMKADKEQQSRGLLDKITKMEVDLQAVEPVKMELQQARADAQSLVTARQELIAKVQQLTQDLQMNHVDSQQIPVLMSELESLRQDYQHCRATYDYEKKLYNDHLESLQVMEKNYLSMAMEVEKLRAELANAASLERRSGGPYGGVTGYKESDTSGHHPVGQNAYEDGYGVSQGRGPPQGSAAAPYVGAPPAAAPARAGYDAPRGPGYDAARGGTGYDAARGGSGYDAARGGSGYDAARGGAGYDGGRGGQGYDAARGGQGYDATRGGQGYDAARGGQGYDAARSGSVGYDAARGGAGYDAARVGAGYDAAARGGSGYDAAARGGPGYDAAARGAGGPQASTAPGNAAPYGSSQTPTRTGGGYEAPPRGGNTSRRGA